MHQSILKRLIELNSQFYQSFGKAFAATRRRIQPGVARLLLELPRQGDWLDLGCGSGAVAAAWAETPGRSGRYLGVDFSTVLLEEALRTAGQGERGETQVQFIQGDLADLDWWLKLEDETYDIISAFAVLHHLPGSVLRKKIIKQAVAHLKPGGIFVHSVWQFQHSQRLMARRQPWKRIGVSADHVEEGDVLLDWRYTLPGEPEQIGLRYVHLFSREELRSLALACGFEILQTFESDGEGGRLGLYQVWKRVERMN